MKALVTGGAGFIGSNLVSLLLQCGHQVSILDNLSSGYRENLSIFADKVKFFEGDVRNRTLLEEAADDVEVIFHLAASVGNKRSIDNPYEDSEINVMGTINVLLTALKQKARKVVFSSSAGIFGEIREIPIGEDHVLDPISPYGASKLGAEKLCLAFDKIYGLETACLRYFNVYGVNQRYDAYGNVIPIFAYKMLHSEPITIYGDGEQTRDFVNVDDVAQANYKVAMTSGAKGAFNIGSGTQITINKLVEIMYEVLNEHPRVIFASPRLGDVRDSLANIQRAKDNFGFQPQVDIKNGLENYLTWAKEKLV